MAVAAAAAITAWGYRPSPSGAAQTARRRPRWRRRQREPAATNSGCERHRTNRQGMQGAGGAGAFPSSGGPPFVTGHGVRGLSLRRARLPAGAEFFGSWREASGQRSVRARCVRQTLPAVDDPRWFRGVSLRSSPPPAPEHESAGLVCRSEPDHRYGRRPVGLWGATRACNLCRRYESGEREAARARLGARLAFPTLIPASGVRVPYLEPGCNNGFRNPFPLWQVNQPKKFFPPGVG